MIQEVNKACKKLNDTLGIHVTLPNPNRTTLKAAAVCNLIAGAGLVTAGIIFSSKCCAALGGISVISSVVLQREHKTMTNKHR